MQGDEPGGWPGGAAAAINDGNGAAHVELPREGGEILGHAEAFFRGPVVGEVGVFGGEFDAELMLVVVWCGVLCPVFVSHARSVRGGVGQILSMGRGELFTGADGAFF